MALAQRPPFHITKIQWPAGDWIVISVKISSDNYNGSFKLNDFADYARDGGQLTEFPFDAGKPSSYKAYGKDPEDQYRGHNSDGGDVWTSLYFLHNEKKESQEVKLTFDKLVLKQQGNNVAYYVWPAEHHNFTFPALPEPTKEQALERLPPEYWGWYNDVWPWVSFYNSGSSWYETWRPGLRAQMGAFIGYAAFDALQEPDHENYGWKQKSDRDAFLQAWNSYAGNNQSLPGAGEAFFPLDLYYAFEIDWSTAVDPNQKPTRQDVEIHAYRLKRNNIVYDAGNALQGKLPKIGKDHATYSFTHEAPTDPRTVTIEWAKKDGFTISG